MYKHRSICLKCEKYLWQSRQNGLYHEYLCILFVCIFPLLGGLYSSPTFVFGGVLVLFVGCFFVGWCFFFFVQRRLLALKIQQRERRTVVLEDANDYLYQQLEGWVCQANVCREYEQFLTPPKTSVLFLQKKGSLLIGTLGKEVFFSLYIQIQEVFGTAAESLFSSNRVDLPGIVAVTFKIFFCLWKDAVYWGDHEALGL